MRYRIKEYTIGGDTDFFVSGKIGVEDIRLIINETQKKVICSSMNKSNVACEYVEDMDATFISFSSSICILQPSDKLTIEVDKGDSLTQVASKVEEVGSKIDNIKLPEIDTTNIASKDLERFWDVVPEYSEEIISEGDIHAVVEDIWNTTFNS